MGVIGICKFTKMKDLRKVQFNLGDDKCKNYSVGDKWYDKDEMLKQRYGLFHCWGEAIRFDLETGEKMQETVAIVEEIATGEVYRVNPNTIVFEKDKE